MRITEDDLTDEGARKQVNCLRKMIRDVCADNDLDDPAVFDKIKFDRSKGSREAFSIEFVHDKILAPGAFDGIDPAVRDVMLVCVDTGARASEIISLLKRNIHLTTKFPYIDIRDGNGREVKTDSAVRQIPLVGVALEAMRRNSDGFPQFHNKIGKVRNMINDRLRALQPEVDVDEGGIHKTLHCLRHTFKDRLRATSARKEMIDAIMGHSTNKPKYGGIDLAAKAAIMEQVVFARVPRLVA